MRTFNSGNNRIFLFPSFNWPLMADRAKFSNICTVYTINEIRNCRFYIYIYKCGNLQRFKLKQMLRDKIGILVNKFVSNLIENCIRYTFSDPR